MNDTDRQYTAPEGTVLGAIKDLTLGKSGDMADMLGGQGFPSGDFGTPGGGGPGDGRP